MDADQFRIALQEINENVNDDDKELFVAIVALVISVVALLASILQVAQQYYASAAGYSSCGEKAIGKWAEATRRDLKPYEFRFEVQFEAPVIFLCRPGNDKGPVKKQPIYFIDGSPQSLTDTRSELKTAKNEPGEPSDKQAREIAKQAVHTADNELASWVTLLSALQQMESDSREWQRKRYEEQTKPSQPPKTNQTVAAREDIDRLLDEVTGSYTLTVAVQRKLKSWDTMPTNIKKPYATTTWCHIVEMLALLGVYWVEFDRTLDRYRGEGNGYTVTGANVSDLGIMFTFQVHGRNRFESNRVIPVDEVKELCFGFVPTIYKYKSDERRLKLPIDESRDLSTLNFATNNEIAETLVLIGCNTNTVNYFSGDGSARVSHLFPVAFEIVGMLAQTLHIERSAFRLLPNPTRFRWDTKNFDLPRLLTAYAYQMKKLYGGKKNPSAVTKRIWRDINSLQEEIAKIPRLGRRTELSLPLMDALHVALDHTDEILTFRRRESRPGIVREYTTKSKLMRAASDRPMQVPEDHKETALEFERREMVRDVLRSHIQEVLYGFNAKVGKTTQDPSGNPMTTGTKTKSRFEAIDAAAPELKQNRLMEVYFRTVRQKVLDEAHRSAERREEEKAPRKPQVSAPPGHMLRRAQTARTTRTMMTADSTDDESEEDEKPMESLDDIEDDRDEPIDLLNVEWSHEISHEDIWCTLVFRMICWLMLHDFHKNDTQVANKSALFGSRLPVYIA
ncbi:modin [Colletotrichum plurivorum]|uniref:Modin n=1 Tax=Colletotrichum plurivorum TaxID=2175906 RepID=A0A8H6NH54_9PEZI|nr:modin [Colletotrichum plurivorum]